MTNLKKYAYPAFMSVSALVTTISDLIQKNDIAIILAVSLGVIGLLALLTPYRLLEKTKPLLSDGSAINTDFSFRSFGVSCLIMAAVVFGFSSLSVRAAPEGGIIASQYPEIHQIQMQLGVVEATTARIEGKTDQLLTATRQWISITELSLNGENSDTLHIRMENNTPFFFKDIRGTVTTSDNQAMAFNGIGLGADGIHFENISAGRPFDSLVLCIIGNRTSDGSAIKEIRKYRQEASSTVSKSFVVEDIVGPIITNESDDCST